MERFKILIKSFSWINAFRTITATRCHSWDNKELDILEGFKFVCVIFIQISATSLMTNPAARATPWSALDMKQTWFFTFVISCNQATDIFIAISAFLGIYKGAQIYEANGGKFYFTDALRMYARKFLRLAPLLYLAFFFGWSMGAWLSSGPNWTNYQMMFLHCDNYWWSQLLLIGNIIPYFQELNGGCFFWAWTFYVDFQLYLLIPLYLIVFMKAPKLGIALQVLIVVLSSIFYMLMAHYYQFRASPLNPEGYYLFAYLINKPWAKMMMHSMGALTGFAYLELLKYRKASLEEKETSYKKLHYF